MAMFHFLQHNFELFPYLYIGILYFYYFCFIFPCSDILCVWLVSYDWYWSICPHTLSLHIYRSVWNHKFELFFWLHILIQWCARFFFSSKTDNLVTGELSFILIWWLVALILLQTLLYMKNYSYILLNIVFHLLFTEVLVFWMLCTLFSWRTLCNNLKCMLNSSCLQLTSTFICSVDIILRVGVLMQE